MDEIFRLAEPRKKGLLHLVFSRFGVIAVLLLIQILIYVSIYGWLRSKLAYFTVLMMLFVICGVVYLFNSGMDSSAKLTWMLIIALLPITGAMFLFFTRMNVGYRTISKRKNELIRPAVSNIDRLFIVIAASRPIPDLLLVDRLMVNARRAGIGVRLVVNKCDLDAEAAR